MGLLKYQTLTVTPVTECTAGEPPTLADSI